MVIALNNIQDPDFQLDKSQEYNLSLLIGPDRLSYLILDKDHKVLVLGSYLFEETQKAVNILPHLNALLEQDPLLSKSYASSQISLYNRRFTIVPKALFNPRAIDVYFETVLPLNTQDCLHVDSIVGLDAKLIYALDQGVEDWLYRYFPEASLKATASAMVSVAVRQIKAQGQHHSVLALVQSKSLSLTVLYKGQLLLHQVYGIAKSEDALYHILHAFKQLGLSPEKQILHLGGELVKDSELYSLLFKYIREIHFVERPQHLQYSTSLNQLPRHFYYDLFCSTL